MQDPRLADDRDGVWLHKLTWARLGPGGVYPLYWYTENIFANNLHAIYGAWRRFMADIPLTNGRYADAEAVADHPDLRVIGQKDREAGRAHLWIDNRRHTWRAVVDGEPVPAIEGTVRLTLGRPGAVYRITWYATVTGEPLGVERLTADAEGALTLTVAPLQSDIAVKVTLEE